MSDRNPNISSTIQSLIDISLDISSLSIPPKSLHRRHISSIIRKSNLLSLAFQDLLLHHSLTPSFEKTYLVLRSFKSLLDDLQTTSKIRSLMRLGSVSDAFHSLNLELLSQLESLPLADLGLSEDAKDLLQLVIDQCRRSDASVDPAAEALRSEVLTAINGDVSDLAATFGRLGLDGSKSCDEEIRLLEDEIGDRVTGKSTAMMISLVGLVRFAQCVLFGSSPDPTDSDPPSDFRCPITLELMRDPVVVASGQTYDRASITRWIASGRATCPKTGQALTHLRLVPNRVLKGLISKWCRECGIPYEGTETDVNVNGVGDDKLTASYLVEKLFESKVDESAGRRVHELRLLSKTGSASTRTWIAESGAIPLIVPFLESDDPDVQIDAVTAILNLSIVDSNKSAIMETEGAFDAVVGALSTGATWRARENAAATVSSLSLSRAHRRSIGGNPRAVAGLVDLLKEGPASSKKDALGAMVRLARNRENAAALVAGGAVGAAVAAVADAAEEAVMVIEAVAGRGGCAAEVVAEEGAVGVLVSVMRDGSEAGRESSAAALVAVCRGGGMAAVAEMMRKAGAERVVYQLMETGTPRARRKAAALRSICRRSGGGADRTVGFTSSTVELRR
ncbi:U-box domain-containing protein 16 [Acorus calamus]|uniref:RING-type E3 ubiquitin transferase n=1 Tax=Acorus calamus TaxID=4465 RepID=A0AAV9EGS8_ACOCL|nr:U-box domain-containing protein 16 [Acorus calamus]